MGHVQSKRKKTRKRTNISPLPGVMTSVTSENIHNVAGHRISRDTYNLDRLSNSSGYVSSNKPSPQSSGFDGEWSPDCERNHWNSGNTVSDNDTSNVTMSALEELCMYKGLPLDDDPVLTELQNEQNARLESMEQRINRIRASAQQAYDRKKFAHMFRAKNVDKETDKLLQEAQEMLQKNIEMRNPVEDKHNYDYSGEIIPVQIVEDAAETQEESDQHFLNLSSFGSLQFSEPIMLFILPFLLPLFIIVAIIRGLSEMFGWKQTTVKVKSRRNS